MPDTDSAIDTTIERLTQAIGLYRALAERHARQERAAAAEGLTVVAEYHARERRFYERCLQRARQQLERARAEREFGP
ncbi:MAG: hypothetical protein KatS3mg060_1191 [Dehalococcoidia bacterium]|nr:MAG: hypothetical protein KatS3mg060_1191 [Dehalococcoidia bacterium]